VFNIGPTELLIILVLALIVFGPQRLPEIGRSIGRSLREFRRASDEIRGEIERDLDDEPRPPTPNQSETTSPSAGSGSSG
jgi:TatA/E family protein of Tat protein translocase